MNKRILLCALICACLSVWPAAANTIIWTQQWDSTPSFSSAYNGIRAEIGTQPNGAFGAPMSRFNTGGSWTSVQLNQYTVLATSGTLLDGMLGSNANVWDLIFSSVETQEFVLKIEYLLNGTPVNSNYWGYDGTGIGNNPVNSWHQVTERAFAPLVDSSTNAPEPGTFAMLGTTSVILGLVGWKRRKKTTT